MKYYYEIIFKTGGGIGGHNLTSFRIEDGFLVLEGYDGLCYTTGYEEHKWKFAYELSNINRFEIKIMKDDWL